MICSPCEKPDMAGSKKKTDLKICVFYFECEVEDLATFFQNPKVKRWVLFVHGCHGTNSQTTFQNEVGNWIFKIHPRERKPNNWMICFDVSKLFLDFGGASFR